MEMKNKCCLKSILGSSLELKTFNLVHLWLVFKINEKQSIFDYRLRPCLIDQIDFQLVFVHPLYNIPVIAKCPQPTMAIAHTSYCIVSYLVVLAMNIDESRWNCTWNLCSEGFSARFDWNKLNSSYFLSS